jgi:hypothetical protein
MLQSPEISVGDLGRSAGDLLMFGDRLTILMSLLGIMVDFVASLLMPSLLGN